MAFKFTKKKKYFYNQNNQYLLVDIHQSHSSHYNKIE